MAGPWEAYQQAPETGPWDAYASTPVATPETPNATAGSMAKQFGVGVGKSLISNAGLGGDLRELAGAGADWLASKFRTPTMSDLIAPGSGPANFNERFSGRPDTIGEKVKTALRNAPGG